MEDSSSFMKGVDPQLKLILDEKDSLRETRVKLEKELGEKVKLLQSEEEKVRERAGELCILEQNLRTINENIYLTQRRIGEKDKSMGVVMKEIGKIAVGMDDVQEKFTRAEKCIEERRCVKEDHIRKLEDIEETLTEVSYRVRFEKLREEINTLQSIKKGLEMNKRQYSCKP